MTIKTPILVTGAAGFVGQHLVEHLLAAGLPVIAFDLPSAHFPARWQARAQIVTGDVRDPATVERAMQNVGTVLHLAAIAIDWGADELHRTVTIEGTRNIMQAAVRHHARVVLASSITVYGSRLQDAVVLDEDLDWGAPAGIYGRSKQGQETLARQIANQTGLELVVLRLGNIYGPRSPQWVDGVIAELRRGTPSLMNGGDFDAGLCYIRNALAAFTLAASNPNVAGQTFNIADGFGVTWKQYFNDLARLARAPRPKPIPLVLARLLAGVLEPAWKISRARTRPPITYEAYNLLGFPLHFPIRRAQTQLEYNPVVTYEQALDEIAAYLAQKKKG